MLRKNMKIKGNKLHCHCCSKGNFNKWQGRAAQGKAVTLKAPVRGCF